MVIARFGVVLDRCDSKNMLLRKIRCRLDVDESSKAPDRGSSSSSEVLRGSKPGG